MSESPELLPVTEKKSSCGCHGHSDERLTLDARAIPHRLRHAAVISAASSLNPGEWKKLKNMEHVGKLVKG